MLLSISSFSFSVPRDPAGPRLTPSPLESPVERLEVSSTESRALFRQVFADLNWILLELISKKVLMLVRHVLVGTGN